MNAAHGRTSYFATQFFPPSKRRHVHALYGFARYADDLVDHMDLSWKPNQRRKALEAWSAEFLTNLETGHMETGHIEEPVLAAVLDTVRELRIATTTCAPSSRRWRWT